jgi:hypothetical protein
MHCGCASFQKKELLGMFFHGDVDWAEYFPRKNPMEILHKMNIPVTIGTDMQLGACPLATAYIYLFGWNIALSVWLCRSGS